jgi:hypothetical protein
MTDQINGTLAASSKESLIDFPEFPGITNASSTCCSTPARVSPGNKCPDDLITGLILAVIGLLWVRYHRPAAQIVGK